MKKRTKKKGVPPKKNRATAVKTNAEWRELVDAVLMQQTSQLDFLGHRITTLTNRVGRRLGALEVFVREVRDAQKELDRAHRELRKQLDVHLGLGDKVNAKALELGRQAMHDPNTGPAA